MRLAGITARPLTASEVAGFLARHPIVATRVGYHNTTSALYCYGPGEETISGLYRWERETLGIPHQGLAVTDNVLGDVLIYPDANCDLRYTATSGVDPDIINAPTPAPVPHDRTMWDDVVRFAEGAVAIGALVLLIRGRS